LGLIERVNVALCELLVEVRHVIFSANEWDEWCREFFLCEHVPIHVEKPWMGFDLVNELHALEWVLFKKFFKEFTQVLAPVLAIVWCVVFDLVEKLGSVL